MLRHMSSRARGGVALVQGLLAERLPANSGIRILECPFEAAPVHEALWWHLVHTHDTGHRWLRETAALVGTTVCHTAPAPGTA